MISNVGKNVEIAKLINCSWNYKNFDSKFQTVDISSKFEQMQKEI